MRNNLFRRFYNFICDLLGPLTSAPDLQAEDLDAPEYVRTLVENVDFCDRVVLSRGPEAVMTILMRVCLFPT